MMRTSTRPPDLQRAFGWWKKAAGTAKYPSEPGIERIFLSRPPPEAVRYRDWQTSAAKGP